MSESIGTMLGQVSRLLRRARSMNAREVGITRPQWQVLSIVSRHPGINQGSLAELLEVEPITTARMIDRLQDAALVERRPDPSDRRAWRLHLTQKGEAQFALILPLAAETLEDALEGIGDLDRERLMAMLAQIRSNLSRRSPAEPASTHG